MRAARGGMFGGALIAAIALLAPPASLAAPVEVKHWEGVAHGFLALRTLEGVPLAEGDLIETTAPTSGGNRVTTRLTLRFKDGSVHDETTVYAQRKTFQFVSNHVVQKGPAFKRPIESTIDRERQVTVRYSDEDGKEKQSRGTPRPATRPRQRDDHRDAQEHLPSDAEDDRVDGRDHAEAAAGEAGAHPRRTGALLDRRLGAQGHALRVKVKVPGVTGAVASLLGKIPPDSHIWLLAGEAPTFVKAELPLFPEGPVWRLELVSPVWPSGSAAKESKEARDSTR